MMMHELILMIVYILVCIILSATYILTVGNIVRDEKGYISTSITMNILIFSIIASVITLIYVPLTYIFYLICFMLLIFYLTEAI